MPPDLPLDIPPRNFPVPSDDAYDASGDFLRGQTATFVMWWHDNKEALSWMPENQTRRRPTDELIEQTYAEFLAERDGLIDWAVAWEKNELGSWFVTAKKEVGLWLFKTGRALGGQLPSTLHGQLRNWFNAWILKVLEWKEFWSRPWLDIVGSQTVMLANSTSRGSGIWFQPKDDSPEPWFTESARLIDTPYCGSGPLDLCRAEWIQPDKKRKSSKITPELRATLWAIWRDRQATIPRVVGAVSARYIISPYTLVLAIAELFCLLQQPARFEHGYLPWALQTSPAFESWWGSQTQKIGPPGLPMALASTARILDALPNTKEGDGLLSVATAWSRLRPELQSTLACWLTFLLDSFVDRVLGPVEQDETMFLPHRTTQASGPLKCPRMTLITKHPKKLKRGWRAETRLCFQGEERAVSPMEVEFLEQANRDGGTLTTDYRARWRLVKSFPSLHQYLPSAQKDGKRKLPNKDNMGKVDVSALKGVVSDEREYPAHADEPPTWGRLP